MRTGLAALLCLLFLLGPAGADDGPPAKPKGTVFLDDLRKGLGLARRTNKPVFVWFSRKEPDENTERLMQRVFHAPGSKAISEQAVAVRLRVGAPYDKKMRSLLRRHEIRRIPTCILLGPDGALIARDVNPSVDGITKLLAQARDAISRWSAIEAQWKKAKDIETRRRLSLAYVARSEYKKARTILRKILAAESRLEDRVVLLRVLRHTGTDKSRSKLLQALLEDHPADSRWVSWRIELAMVGVALPLPVARAELLATLTVQKGVLRELAAEMTDLARQVEVHAVLARAHQELGEKEDLLAQCEIIREKLEKLPERPDLRRQLAEMFMAADTYEEAKKELLSIFKDHPDSREAPEALYLLAEIFYRQARSKEDVLDSMMECNTALGHLVNLGERYPNSEAYRRTEEHLMPALMRLLGEQLKASQAEIEREEKKRKGDK